MNSKTLRVATGRGAGLLPSAFVILLPKCPLCVAAWAGLFGAAGLDLAAYQRWLLPFSGLLLAVSAWLIARRTDGNVRIAVISAEIAAVELILAGKLWLDSPDMAAAGGILLLGAAVASCFGGKTTSCEPCGRARYDVQRPEVDTRPVQGTLP